MPSSRYAILFPLAVVVAGIPLFVATPMPAQTPVTEQTDGAQEGAPGQGAPQVRPTLNVSRAPGPGRPPPSRVSAAVCRSARTSSLLLPRAGLGRLRLSFVRSKGPPGDAGRVKQKKGEGGCPFSLFESSGPSGLPPSGAAL